MRACNRKTKKVTVAAKAGQFKSAAANVLHQITGAVCNLLDFTLLTLRLVFSFVYSGGRTLALGLRKRFEARV